MTVSGSTLRRLRTANAVQDTMLTGISPAHGFPSSAPQGPPPWTLSPRGCFGEPVQLQLPRFELSHTLQPPSIRYPRIGRFRLLRRPANLYPGQVSDPWDSRPALARKEDATV